MRRIALLLTLCLPMMAATKLRLHNAASEIAGYKAMDTQLGIGSVINSITATTSGGTDIQATDTSGGTALAWISDPVQTGFTMSGTVTCNLYGGESNAAANAAWRCRLFKYSGGVEGSAIMLGEMSTELTTTLTAQRNWTNSTTGNGFVTSTAFAVGDRIVFKYFLENCATSGCPTGTMGAAQTTTMHYDGPTAAANGESLVQLTENVVFGQGATPSIVQRINGVNSVSGSGSTITAYKVKFPNLTLTGNAILVSGMVSNGPTITCTDDASDTFVTVLNVADGTNGQTGFVCLAQNITAGGRQVTVTFSGANSFETVSAYELTNIQSAAALDGVASNVATAATTLTGGAVVPGSTGDWLCQFVLRDNPLTTASFTIGSQSNITWAFTERNLFDGSAAQCGVYSSTSSITPQFTTGTSGDYISMSIALKNATHGTAATITPRVLAVSHFNSPQDAGAGGNGTTAPANPTFGFPSSGTTQILTWTSGGTYIPTAVSDATNGSWTATSCGTTTNDSNVLQYYIGNSTPSANMLVTTTTTGNAGASADGTAVIYDVTGLATSPYDTCATATGNQTVAGALTAMSLTPTTSGGLVIGQLGVAQNTITTIGCSNCLFDSLFGTGHPTDGPFAMDENNGWMHYYNPNTSAISFVWNTDLGSRAMSLWAAMAAAYKAPAAGGKPSGHPVIF